MDRGVMARVWRYLGGKWPYAWGTLVSVAVALWQSWPLPTRFNDALPRRDTDPLFHTWAIHAWHAAWDMGRWWPDFSANNFFPHDGALAFSDTFLGQALVSYPAHVLGASPITAHNVAFVVCFSLVPFGAFVGAWWLTRRHAASLVALLVCGLAQHRETVSDHLNIMSAWALVPCLAAWVLCWRRPTWKRGALLGSLYGVQWWFTGQVSVVAAVGFALPLGLAMVLSAPTILRKPKPSFQCWASAFLCALILAGPIAYAHTWATEALGQVRSLEDNITYAVEWREYLRSHGASWLQSKLSNPGGFALYPGAVAVVLAVVGLGSGAFRRSRRSGLLALLAAVTVWCFVLSLGPVLRPARDIRLPYFYLYEALTPLRSMRSPSRFFIPMTAALGLWAALSTKMLWPRWRKPTWRSALALVLPALVAWDLWPRPMALQGGLGRSALMEQWSQKHPGESVTEIPDGRPENFAATWRSIFHTLNTTAGTSGSTPPLTGALRCRTNLFPLPPSLDVLLAAGVQNVALHLPARGFGADILGVAAWPPGIVPGPRDAQTALFQLGGSAPRFASAAWLEQTIRQPLPILMPQRVPPGTTVNAALDLAPLVDGTRVSPRPAVPVRLELTQGTRVHTARTTLMLPAILDAFQHHAPLGFISPRDPGAWTITVWSRETQVAVGQFEVGAGAAGPNMGAQMTLQTNAWPWLSGRCGAVQVIVRNTGDTTLHAYAQPLTLPPEKGRISLELLFLQNGRAAGQHTAHQWQRRNAILWHDVGPGQDAHATAEVEAPGLPGTYELRAKLVETHGPPITTVSTTVEVTTLRAVH